MAGIGSVVVQFLADDKMSKTVGGITRAVQGLNKDLDDSDSKGSKWGKALAGAAVAAGTAMVGAGAALINFAKAAAEDAAQAKNLANTLATIPGVTDDMIAANAQWIDSMELATTVADTDLRVAVSKLALATGDLGQAQQLTALAVDVAAGSGKNLKSVTDALAKAVQGNTSALSRQFPWLDKNKDGTVTLDEALGGLEGAYKGAAKAAADQKPRERFAALMDQLKETIGDALNPQIKKFGDWLGDKKNQEKVTGFAQDIATVVKACADFVGVLISIVGWFKSAYNWLDDLSKKLDEFYNAVDRFGQKVLPWRRASSGLSASAAYGSGQYRTAGPSARSLSTGAAPAAPPVFVTDEMVARAVGDLLLRSQARNGRVVLLS